MIYAGSLQFKLQTINGKDRDAYERSRGGVQATADPAEATLKLCAGPHQRGKEAISVQPSRAAKPRESAPIPQLLASDGATPDCRVAIPPQQWVEGPRPGPGAASTGRRVPCGPGPNPARSRGRSCGSSHRLTSRHLSRVQESVSQGHPSALIRTGLFGADLSVNLELFSV